MTSWTHSLLLVFYFLIRLTFFIIGKKYGRSLNIANLYSTSWNYRGMMKCMWSLWWSIHYLRDALHWCRFLWALYPVSPHTCWLTSEHLLMWSGSRPAIYRKGKKIIIKISFNQKQKNTAIMLLFQNENDMVLVICVEIQ